MYRMAVDAWAVWPKNRGQAQTEPLVDVVREHMKR